MSEEINKEYWEARDKYMNDLVELAEYANHTGDELGEYSAKLVNLARSSAIGKTFEDALKLEVYAVLKMFRSEFIWGEQVMTVTTEIDGEVTVKKSTNKVLKHQSECK
jgi:hypothetical protein